MARRRKVELSRQAAEDLENIYDYTIQTWSAAQAERYIRELNTALRALANGEMLGRARDDLAEDHLSRRVGSHLVIYRETDEALFVVRILHASMDLRRHLS